MPKHAPKVDPITYSSAIAENPDLPGRVDGELDDAVLDIEKPLKDFTAAVEAAAAAGIPHGVLRRTVEIHEWDNAPAVR